MSCHFGSHCHMAYPLKTINSLTGNTEQRTSVSSLLAKTFTANTLLKWTTQTFLFFFFKSLIFHSASSVLLFIYFAHFIYQYDSFNSTHCINSNCGLGYKYSWDMIFLTYFHPNYLNAGHYIYLQLHCTVYLANNKLFDWLIIQCFFFFCTR